MDIKGKSYIYHPLRSGKLAQELHRVLQPEAGRTYQNGIFIDIRWNDDFFQVMARSDDIWREFVQRSGGETSFTETWPNHDPYEIGSVKTTIMFPDGKVMEKLDVASANLHTTLSTHRNSKILEGEEANRMRATHRYFSTELVPLLRQFMDSPRRAIKEPEDEILGYRKADGSGQNVIFPEPPRKIISMAELIESLGRPPGNG